MGIFAEVVIASLAALGVVTLAWIVWSLTVLPVRGADGEKLTVIVPAKNGAELWRVHEGIFFLERMGILDATIIIQDGGLDGAQLEEARNICRRYNNVKLCKTEENSEGILNGRTLE